MHDFYFVRATLTLSLIPLSGLETQEQTMDFDAESSSTEAAVAFTTVSEVAAAVDGPRDVGNKSSARDVEPERGEERHNTASLKSDVSALIVSFYFSTPLTFLRHYNTCRIAIGKTLYVYSSTRVQSSRVHNSLIVAYQVIKIRSCINGPDISSNTLYLIE